MPTMLATGRRRASLSPRERQVLDAYGRLWSWKLVGAELQISESTAKQHGYVACRKLGVERIGQAVILANRRSRPRRA